MKTPPRKTPPRKTATADQDAAKSASPSATLTRSRGSDSVSQATTVPGLTILSHPNPRRIGERCALTALVSGREVALSRVAPEFVDVSETQGASSPEPLADPHLSRSPVQLVPLPDDGVRLLPSPRLRTVVDGEELREARDLSSEHVRRGTVLLLEAEIVLLLHPMDPTPPVGAASCGLIGESAAVHALRRDILQVADLDVPVLLRGATGTGKELTARALHEASPRRGGPFVAVNLGAIPPTLAAAELFGAVKGAFTGADRRRKGCFENARGGTLFLDEIGEAPPEVQVLLLRALETGRIRPVGAEAEQAVDVRVLAATDADLESAIAAERFREPLLHRLAGYEIHLPSLAERRDDLGRLIVHFLRSEAETLGTNLPPSQGVPWPPASWIARLALCEWTGNVRQLRNIVRQLVIANRDAAQWRLPPQVERMLDASKSVPAIASETAPQNTTQEPAPPGATSLGRRKYRSPSDVGEEELIEALRAHGFNLKPTADALGISRPSLYDLVEKSSKIRKASELDAEEIERSQELFGDDFEAMSRHLEVSAKGLRRRMIALGFA